MTNADDFKVQRDGYGSWYHEISARDEEYEEYIDAMGYVQRRKKNERSTDPVLSPDFIEGHTEHVNMMFVTHCPEYYRSDDNLTALVNGLSLKFLKRPTDNDNVDDNLRLLVARNFYTLDNLKAVFYELYTHGEIEPKPGVFRQLTENELAQISRECVNVRDEGDVDRVLNQWCRFALGSYSPRSWRDLAPDPAYSDLLAEASIFVWKQYALTYEDTPERDARIRRFVGHRFPSFNLLNAAWRTCQAEEGARGDFLSDTDRALETYL